MIIGEGNDVVQSASRTAFSVALHRRHPDPGIATFIVHLPENKKLPKNHHANVSETTTTGRHTKTFFLQPEHPRDGQTGGKTHPGAGQRESQDRSLPLWCGLRDDA